MKFWHLLSPQNCRKSNVEECIFDYMALHIERRFNKNSLLQCYFLAILPAGKYRWIYYSPFSNGNGESKWEHLSHGHAHQFDIFTFLQKHLPVRFVSGTKTYDNKSNRITFSKHSNQIKLLLSFFHFPVPA